MNTERVIEALKYLISGDCTDTAMDYADEIEWAIEWLGRPEHRVCVNCAYLAHPVEWKDAHRAYCGVCGKRIPLKIKANFCHKCGRKLLWIDPDEVIEVYFNGTSTKKESKKEGMVSHEGTV